MIASTQKLSDFLDGLPKTLRIRYSANNDAFGVRRANFVLNTIEKEIDANYYYNQFPLILLDGVTWYKITSIDPSIRKICGIYQVFAGNVNPDWKNPMRFREKGNHLELEYMPTVNDDDDFSGTVTAASGNALDRFIDSTGVDLAALEDNKLLSSLCKYTDASLGVSRYFVAIGNTKSLGLIILNGELDELPVAGDVYQIIYNYFMIIAKRYIARVSDPDDIIDIPQDWEELFECGLRWQFQKQTEENDKDAVAAYNIFRAELARVKLDEQRKHGDNPLITPRDIPQIYDN